MDNEDLKELSQVYLGNTVKMDNIVNNNIINNTNKEIPFEKSIVKLKEKKLKKSKTKFDNYRLSKSSKGKIKKNISFHGLSRQHPDLTTSSSLFQSKKTTFIKEKNEKIEKIVKRVKNDKNVKKDIKEIKIIENLFEKKGKHFPQIKLYKLPKDKKIATTPYFFNRDLKSIKKNTKNKYDLNNNIVNYNVSVYPLTFFESKSDIDIQDKKSELKKIIFNFYKSTRIFISRSKKKQINISTTPHKDKKKRKLSISKYKANRLISTQTPVNSKNSMILKKAKIYKNTDYPIYNINSKIFRNIDSLKISLSKEKNTKITLNNLYEKYK